MTTTKSAPADYLLGAQQLSAAQQPNPVVENNDNNVHLLRLVLDLQLDALLLGLGAAAIHESRSSVVPPALGASGAGTWPRWVVEDVDLARALATEAVRSGAALPTTLGPEPYSHEDRSLLDQLTGHFESMHNLLADVLGRTTAGLTSIRRNQLLELMAHCHKRLTELRTLAETPRAPRTQASTEHQYLPGELLG